ncbi:MAG TPA: polysaccharide deacetylase family protein [Gemmatimonadaceae bacterium]|nr:polysaccharide deacetylase family protein [Gemmatimonadaceae bacterium]
MKPAIRFAAVAVMLGAVSIGAQTPQGARSIQERLGYPANAKLLIIHADDFGMNHSVNRATMEALENGWVQSASILVPCPWFAEVATWARKNPQADLGIHLALNSEWTTERWGPISGRSEVPTLLASDGYLPLETDVVQKANPAEIEKELRAQIDFAKKAGVNLTHLDSHMGALFQTEAPFTAYLRMGRDYNLPQLIERQGERGGAEAPAWAARAQSDALIDRVLGIGPGVSKEQWVDAYKKMLSPLGPGVYQLIVHVAYDDPEMRGATFDHPDWGAAWRQQDFDMVKSQAWRDWLKSQGFTLVGWKALARARSLTP